MNGNISSDSETIAALYRGYRVLTEGAGEVDAAKYVYDHVVRPVGEFLSDPANKEQIYQMMSDPEDRAVVHDFTDADGNREWTVRFVKLGNGEYRYSPRYYQAQKVISIPLYPFLAGTYRATPGMSEQARENARLTLLFKDGVLADSRRNFNLALLRAWNFPGGPANGTTLRDTLLHEGIHLFDDRFAPDMQMDEEHKYLSKEDREAQARIDKAGTLYAQNQLKQDEDTRKRMFPAWYSRTRYGKNDIKKMSEFRRSFPVEDLQRYSDETAISRNTNMPTKWEGYDNIRKAGNKYQYWLTNHSNMETRAYLMEQLPILLGKKRHGVPYNINAVSQEIVDHVFNVPEPKVKQPPTDEFGHHSEQAFEYTDPIDQDAWRKRVQDAILPDAKRSVERRARNLVAAINAIDPPDDMTISDKMSLLKDYMDRIHAESHQKKATSAAQ